MELMVKMPDKEVIQRHIFYYDGESEKNLFWPNNVEHYRDNVTVKPGYPAIKDMIPAIADVAAKYFFDKKAVNEFTIIEGSCELMSKYAEACFPGIRAVKLEVKISQGKFLNEMKTNKLENPVKDFNIWFFVGYFVWCAMTELYLNQKKSHKVVVGAEAAAAGAEMLPREAEAVSRKVEVLLQEAKESPTKAVALLTEAHALLSTVKGLSEDQVEILQELEATIDTRSTKRRKPLPEGGG